MRQKLELEQEAGRDPLTGVHNHGSLYRKLAEELEAARRYGRPLSYLMLDIDNFKEVNDTFGHRHGDELLKRLAKNILATIRKVDVVARYGGDEFGIILQKRMLRELMFKPNESEKRFAGFNFRFQAVKTEPQSVWVSQAFLMIQSKRLKT
jgi:diguanylate cyclase (GGDEF)-like protein